MFDWLFKKRDVEEIKEETKRGFESVKKDITAVSGWIKHLDSEKNFQKREIEDIKNILSSIQEEVQGIKNVVSFMGEMKTNSRSSGSFKTPGRVLNKQTSVYDVQTPVQMGVQTPNLNNFSVSERAMIWVLLNTDLKLSYDDIAAMLGKDKSTVRGQINTIRQKSDGLILEIIEANGKKRVYINDEIKEKLLKKQKVRVKKGEKTQEK